ncbi:MAG TPA: class I SAM-dependent methyltransferase [Shinella sp.]|jgi:cyclopropane fatty-acyl-phospholipid synthase-like methyltransferase|uniref:class I SAM-dependent methyltransferase n=1 Tax=Shinella sp. TaxID=1870904 RepID=UPI002E16491D|nr:class I SAM-dependent methyltransferase [Shinella sp.]
MLVETKGGYDEGYEAITGFWGTKPGSLVRNYLADHDVVGSRVLDVGAGEGKNSAAFARAGAEVVAVECSAAAIRNGRRLFPSEVIEWTHRDAVEMDYPKNSYDVIVSYGLTHCLPSEVLARRLISELQAALVPGGTFILVSFNSGSHDLSAHPGFQPLLLSHAWFVSMFDGWQFQNLSDSILFETHPHNNIPHHHSLTRLTATKP